MKKICLSNSIILNLKVTNLSLFRIYEFRYVLFFYSIVGQNDELSSREILNEMKNMMQTNIMVQQQIISGPQGEGNGTIFIES